ncbi:CapA family protein [Bifidobacterium sp. ESL0763]|uniref:CapA family protein n=1 Tax=Bifidobacterium sp. ESL0763 TaxID=2983227 RepID=UPI0023F9C88A|nr:CapA family protein [Bifidobacterium sp. ESL0763]MDF7663559.1 CapA family protein [Bifidobacterium sp. ESL0763]
MRHQPRHDMKHAAHHSAHARADAPGVSARLVTASSIVLLALAVACVALFLGFSNHDSAFGVRSGETNEATAINRKATPKPVTVHHGNSPDCPDSDCIALFVNGDLLFHEGLWEHFQNNPSATDGTAFNFDPLFANMKPYIQHSDIAVCEFETPVAQRGGPYTAYPVFNIPPEVVDAAQHVGYNACTHGTNHSWDQGAAGIDRLWDDLDQAGIAQTGSYKTEADSMKPLVIDSPTGGGKMGLVTGTVSLNAMTPDYDWRVDRLREDGDPHHDSDIQRAVTKAHEARKQGADVVAIAMHSLQEYLTKADSWQVSEAHELADTGAFDVIYGAGCHCAQPIEYYHNTWIVYGLGNAVTVTSYIPGNEVNNQGVSARIQFAGKRGKPGTWRVSRIDWVPTANMQQGQYRWCPIANDHPDGTCWDQATDAKQEQRINNVIYSMGADSNVVHEWRLTDEQQQPQKPQKPQQKR